MVKRYLRLWLAIGVAAGIVVVPHALAQFAKAPESYTVTQTGMMSGSGTMKVYRDGTKAVIEHLNPDGGGTRSFYDLQAHTDISWDIKNAAAGCGSGNFSGDWGDPFASSADMAKELNTPGTKEVGAETVNGFATKVYEITGATPEQSGKAWIDTKFGLVIKAVVAGQTLAEIKELSLAKPPASVFAVPAACTKAAAAPAAVTGMAKIAADSGLKNPADYADATQPPASASSNSCTVLFKIVRAGTLEAAPTAFALGLDVDQNSTGQYPPGANGARFAGTMKDVTAQYRNGVLRIDNAPPHFLIDAQTRNGGASGMMYRQCFQPQTVLMLIVKDPANIGVGPASWVWSKTGK